MRPWSPLQPTEPRFLQLHDELLLTGRQMTQWATAQTRQLAQLLDPHEVYICELVHYRHHWPMSWLTVQLEPSGQLAVITLETTGQATLELELALGTDTKLVRAKKPHYPEPYSREVWEGYSLACPVCGLVSHAPGLDPDQDSVGPIARAQDLYRIHYDQAHREQS